MSQESSIIEQTGDVLKDFNTICTTALDRLNVGVMLLRIAGSPETYFRGKDRCREALEILKGIEGL